MQETQSTANGITLTTVMLVKLMKAILWLVCLSVCVLCVCVCLSPCVSVCVLCVMSVCVVCITSVCVVCMCVVRMCVCVCSCVCVLCVCVSMLVSVCMPLCVLYGVSMFKWALGSHTVIHEAPVGH